MSNRILHRLYCKSYFLWISILKDTCTLYLCKHNIRIYIINLYESIYNTNFNWYPTEDDKLQSLIISIQIYILLFKFPRYLWKRRWLLTFSMNRSIVNSLLAGYVNHFFRWKHVTFAGENRTQMNKKRDSYSQSITFISCLLQWELDLLMMIPHMIADCSLYNNSEWVIS